ncbi:MAG: hypothetical protein ISP42_06045 [Alphaproteobacteria bacterium]|nr:hypothetical protein [Alphaproteobacteria bacterium]
MPLSPATGKTGAARAKIQIADNKGGWQTVQTVPGNRIAVKLALQRALRHRPGSSPNIARAIDSQSGKMIARLEKD